MPAEVNPLVPSPPAWGDGPLRGFALDWRTDAGDPEATIRTRLLQAILASADESQPAVELALWELPAVDGDACTLGAWLMFWATWRPIELRARVAGYQITGRTILDTVRDIAREENAAPVVTINESEAGQVAVRYGWSSSEPLMFERSGMLGSASPDLWKQLDRWPIVGDVIDAKRITWASNWLPGLMGTTAKAPGARSVKAPVGLEGLWDRIGNTGDSESTDGTTVQKENTASALTDARTVDEITRGRVNESPHAGGVLPPAPHEVQQGERVEKIPPAPPSDGGPGVSPAALLASPSIFDRLAGCSECERLADETGDPCPEHVMTVELASMTRGETAVWVDPNPVAGALEAQALDREPLPVAFVPHPGCFDCEAIENGSAPETPHLTHARPVSDAEHADDEESRAVPCLCGRAIVPTGGEPLGQDPLCGHCAGLVGAGDWKGLLVPDQRADEAIYWRAIRARRHAKQNAERITAGDPPQIPVASHDLGVLRVDGEVIARAFLSCRTCHAHKLGRLDAWAKQAPMGCPWCKADARSVYVQNCTTGETKRGGDYAATSTNPPAPRFVLSEPGGGGLFGPEDEGKPKQRKKRATRKKASETSDHGADE